MNIRQLAAEFRVRRQLAAATSRGKFAVLAAANPEAASSPSVVFVLFFKFSVRPFLMVRKLKTDFEFTRRSQCPVWWAVGSGTENRNRFFGFWSSKKDKNDRFVSFQSIFTE